MADYATRLQNYLNESGIDAHMVDVEKATTVNEAVEELGCTKRDIIKSIAFMTDDGQVLIAIVDGAASVDKKKVRKLIDKDVRIANGEEVEKHIGFPPGGVPPVGHTCRVFLDDRVLQKDKVYGGGGDDRHLILISTSEVAEQSEVVKLRK
ncbi:MAG: YbaK/EbsC family protein [Archaeoglobaceae archaeon]